MGYCGAVFGRPPSQYVFAASAVFVVASIASFLFGMTYASLHREPVKYGPFEWLVLPIMLIGLLFFVGSSDPHGGTSTDASVSLVMIDEAELQRRERIAACRVIGVAVFCAGGCLLGLSVVFFRWFDVLPSYMPLPCPTFNSTAGTLHTSTHQKRERPFSGILTFVFFVIQAPRLCQRRLTQTPQRPHRRRSLHQASSRPTRCLRPWGA